MSRSWSNVRPFMSSSCLERLPVHFAALFFCLDCMDKSVVVLLVFLKT